MRDFFPFVVLVWGFAVSVFWMIVGWRAMQAHEKMADILEVLRADSADERRARMQSQNRAPPSSSTQE